MSINIDLDFDEISGDISDRELVDELIDRMPGLSEQNKEKIIMALDIPENEVSFEIKTLDDEIKVEHLNKVFDKYTSHQLEQLIPEI